MAIESVGFKIQQGHMVIDGCVSSLWEKINLCPAKLIYLNFHPLEVVSRYRDPQLQVDENYSDLFYFGHKYLQILVFRHTFHS